MTTCYVVLLYVLIAEDTTLPRYNYFISSDLRMTSGDIFITGLTLFLYHPQRYRVAMFFVRYAYSIDVIYVYIYRTIYTNIVEVWHYACSIRKSGGSFLIATLGDFCKKYITSKEFESLPQIKLVNNSARIIINN